MHAAEHSGCTRSVAHQQQSWTDCLARGRRLLQHDLAGLHGGCRALRCSPVSAWPILLVLLLGTCLALQHCSDGASNHAGASSACQDCTRAIPPALEAALNFQVTP